MSWLADAFDVGDSGYNDEVEQAEEDKPSKPKRRKARKDKGSAKGYTLAFLPVVFHKLHHRLPRGLPSLYGLGFAYHDEHLLATCLLLPRRDNRLGGSLV